MCEFATFLDVIQLIKNIVRPDANLNYIFAPI